jgi:L-arabinonolactonase
MNGHYHREREAGFLFAIHGLGVRGLPEPRFAG